MVEVYPVIYSGYRLGTLEPRQRPYAWEELKRNVKPYHDLLSKITDPYYLDDSLRGVPAGDLLNFSLQTGEFIVCAHEGRLAGFMWLAQIMHERSAVLEAWADPSFRSSYRDRKILSAFAHDVIDYAFRPFGPIPEGGGLGLKKLKAVVAEPNRASYRSLRALGFQVIGVSPLDGLYDSLLTDTLILELLNPEYFGLAEPEVIKNYGRKQQASSSPGIPVPASLQQPRTVSGAASVSGTDGPVILGPGSLHSTTSDDGGSAGGETAPLVAPILQSEPDGPSGTEPVRKRLLRPKHRTAAGASASGPLL